MPNVHADALARIREQIAANPVRPGFHPYYRFLTVMPDEPLWSISFQLTRDAEWTRPDYRTATVDLDEAIEEARNYLRMPKRARVYVHPTIPRCETYTKAQNILMDLLMAVPGDHPQTEAMAKQIVAACRTVRDAEKEGQDIGGLRIDLPIAVNVREHGRTRSMQSVMWGNHGGWPEWNRCTVAPTIPA